MADSTYTPDPATTKAITDAWRASDYADLIPLEFLIPVAEIAERALAAAGRLLPADAETRTQHGVRLTWEDGHSEDFERGSLAAAEAMHDHHVEQRRNKPSWLVTSTLIHREVGSWVGPWLPEESGA